MPRFAFSVALAAVVVTVGLALMTACSSDDGPAAPAGPRFQLDEAGSVSGSVLGPDGTSICHFIPDGSGLVVRVLNPPPVTPSFAGSQFVDCPDSSFAIALSPGSYFLRVTLPSDPGIGTLPGRYLVTDPVAVSLGDVHQDIRIFPGSGLAGGITFDGVPLPGIAIRLAYDRPPGYVAAAGTSGADGGWMDDAGREPMVLQSAVRYQVAEGCDVLGAKRLEQPPTGGFLFPSELSAINCTLTTAPAVAFSHDRTRLVVTPLPGDVGGLSPDLWDQFGSGWGVQFPVPPGQHPVHGPFTSSQLFRGGLVVGIRPARILSGVDRSGYTDCTLACRDFGLDGRLQVTTSPQFGKKVIWHYSDATSPEGVGLKVLQKSYDGVPPHDYVLFHFILTNSGESALTFFAGMFADWDVNGDGSDDIGGTEMNGRLMYITDQTPGGAYAGTLLLGHAPVSGNALFQTGQVGTDAEMVAALAGDFHAPTASDPADQRYLQALGPITLKRGKSFDIWIAVVAGETHDQLLANAAAAAADVAQRGDDMSDDSEAADGTDVSNGFSRNTKHLNAWCKRDCVH